VYNLHQHINDTYNTDVVENDYISVVTNGVIDKKKLYLFFSLRYLGAHLYIFFIGNQFCSFKTRLSVYINHDLLYNFIKKALRKCFQERANFRR
jgi:hypothetical protein